MYYQLSVGYAPEMPFACSSEFVFRACWLILCFKMLGSECVYFLYSFVEGLVFFLSLLLSSKFTFERLVVS